MQTEILRSNSIDEKLLLNYLVNVLFGRDLRFSFLHFGGCSMKKFLKYLLIAVGGIILILGSVALYINMSGLPTYDTPKIDLKVEVTPQRVERGRKIANMLCRNCHQNPITKQLTGNLMVDLPKEFGDIHSRNITQHPTKGIGSWTDGEIAYLLRTGIRRNGRYAPPYMIKLPRVPDEDIYSIIAYLRSDDPTVKAADVDNIEPKESFLTKILCRVVFKPFEYPQQKIAVPDTNNKYEYGKYLSNDLLGCYECHSADFKTMDDHFPEKSEGYFGGGNAMVDYNQRIIYTSNITPDKATGIGNWTEADFIRTMRTGFNPQGKPLRYPMLTEADLTDNDLSALYAFIKTVPAINHQVPTSVLFDATSDKTEGQKIFHKYSCQSCHGESGAGFANLTQANIKYPTNDILKDVIQHPKNYLGESTKMLTWAGVIKDEEFEPLCNYVRELGKKYNK